MIVYVELAVDRIYRSQPLSPGSHRSVYLLAMTPVSGVSTLVQIGLDNITHQATCVGMECRVEELDSVITNGTDLISAFAHTDRLEEKDLPDEHRGVIAAVLLEYKMMIPGIQIGASRSRIRDMMAALEIDPSAN